MKTETELLDWYGIEVSPEQGSSVNNWLKSRFEITDYELFWYKFGCAEGYLTWQNDILSGQRNSLLRDIVFWKWFLGVWHINDNAIMEMAKKDSSERIELWYTRDMLKKENQGQPLRTKRDYVKWQLYKFEKYKMPSFLKNKK